MRRNRDNYAYVFQLLFCSESLGSRTYHYCSSPSCTASFESVLVASRRIPCLPPTGIIENILPWVCWQIWLARNQLLFENKTLLPTEVVLRSITAAREWAAAQSLNQKTRIVDMRNQGERTQISANQSFTCCHTDAAWDKESLRAGLGWIFSNQQGQIGRGSEAQNFVSSPLMAEALACLSMLNHALSSRIENLRVFWDNQPLVRVINSNLMEKEIFGVVTDIKNLSELFSFISFSFVPRSENHEADRLSKLVLRDPCSASFVSLNRASDSTLGRVVVG